MVDTNGNAVQSLGIVVRVQHRLGAVGGPVVHHQNFERSVGLCFQGIKATSNPMGTVANTNGDRNHRFGHSLHLKQLEEATASHLGR